MPGPARNCLLGIVVALALAGCGGEDEGSIPSSFSNSLVASLDSAEEAADSGDCDTAAQHAQAFADAVNSPPEGIEAEVQSALTEAAGNLVTLIAEDCQPAPTGATGELGVEPPVEAPAVTPEEEATTPEEEATTPEDDGDEDDGGSQGAPPDQGGGNPGQGQGGGPSSGGIGGD